MMNDTDPFSDVESADEIFALVLQSAGPEGLEQLLNMAVRDRLISRDSLMTAADGLADAGLMEGADMVAHAVEQIDPVSSEVYAIVQDPNASNAKCSLARLLRQDKLTPADMAFIEESHPDVMEYLDKIARMMRTRQ